jgi:ArsR family transcriptional regulator, arsenate/arsenite/antimonite-responsive transcriptional repressor
MLETVSIPHATAADALGALGHEARLAIFRALVRAGDAGLPVHRIQERLGGMPRSTLAHHLQALVLAGLVQQDKVGAEVVNRADFATMRSLVAYLSAECCADACGSALAGLGEPLEEVGSAER